MQKINPPCQANKAKAVANCESLTRKLSLKRVNLCELGIKPIKILNSIIWILIIILFPNILWSQKLPTKDSLAIMKHINLYTKDRNINKDRLNHAYTTSIENGIKIISNDKYYLIHFAVDDSLLNEKVVTLCFLILKRQKAKLQPILFNEHTETQALSTRQTVHPFKNDKYIRNLSSGKLLNLNKGYFQMVFYDTKENDAECCPSVEVTETYRIKNGKVCFKYSRFKTVKY